MHLCDIFTCVTASASMHVYMYIHVRGSGYCVGVGDRGSVWVCGEEVTVWVCEVEVTVWVCGGRGYCVGVWG